MGLTREEDATLRRLAALARYGPLSPSAGKLYDELRRRDRRATVREPIDLVLIPLPRTALDDTEIAGDTITV